MVIRLLTVFIACSMLSGVSVSSGDAFGQGKNLIERLEQVAVLIRNDQIKEAERRLTTILRSQPNSSGALNLLGTIRAKQGKLHQAENLFLRAIRSDSRFTSARMNLAYLYLINRTPLKAIAQFREVLLLEPTNAEAAQRLAELYVAKGLADEAIKVLDQQPKSQSSALLVLLGDAYLIKGDLVRAEENYLMSLDGQLNNASALLGLAQISQAKGETREAVIYLKRVASLINEAESPDFLYRFAFTALKSDMSDEAKQALEKALKARPDDPSYLLLLGVAWLRKTDLFEAEKIFRRLLELQPDSFQGQLHLGYILLNQKKPQEARQWLEKSARAKDPVPEVYYYLGLVAQEQNDDHRAIELFEKAVQKLPSYAHARAALGLSYMKIRNYARAREELETAVKLQPDEPTAHYNLALLYARIKEPERAREQMRIVEELKNRSANADGGVVVLPPPAPR